MTIRERGWLQTNLEEMQERGSSVTLTWGEDTGAWECSWITSGKRFTAVNSDPALACSGCADEGLPLREDCPKRRRSAVSLVNKSAIFSEDRKYRYVLIRRWDRNRPLVNVIGLNPSVADEEQDDPTIRRCIGYAKAWGYGGLVMTNIFAFRSTDPKGIPQDGQMDGLPEAIGPDNDRHIFRQARDAGLVVAAWGSQPRYQNFRIRDVLSALAFRDLLCIRKTKNGYPAHPLYLQANLMPVLFAAQTTTLTGYGAP